MMSLKSLGLFLLILLKSTLIQALCSEAVPHEYIITTSIPDQVISKISKTSLNAKSKTSSGFNFIFDHRPSLNTIQAKVSRPNLDVSTLILKLSQDELAVLKKLESTVIEPNCYIESDFSTYSEQTSIAPFIEDFSFNDTFNKRQWYLDFLKFKVPQSEISNRKVKIAISDTGFDVDHEDLKNNIWVNEVELNGRANFDDDGNGCIDDFQGCDIADNDNSVEVNRYKSNLIEHGTHVAGLIGAISDNNLGISGISKNVELILVKSFSSHRKTTMSDLLKSIYYSVKSNADILNCSWGSGSKPTIAEFKAFEFARLNNVVVVVAAGNSSVYASETSPAGLSNVLTVGSHNSLQQLSTFSNFGSAVDILAPGGDGVERKNESLISLSPNNSYTEKRGTSMSAPLVSASLGLLKSYYPQLNRIELLNILLASSDTKETSAFFDPKIKNNHLFINLSSAFELANNYVNAESVEIYNQLRSELNTEPKKIVKPQESVRAVSSQSTDAEASAKSSGCQNNSALNQANSSSLKFSFILFIFPLLLIIKKRTS